MQAALDYRSGLFTFIELVQLHFISVIITLVHSYRGVAQLVARTAGGREVAGSSPVTPTTFENLYWLFVIIN